MSRILKDAPDALEACASVSKLLAMGLSKRKREDSSSSSSDDEPRPETGPNKPSGWFHNRRILEDANFNARHLPAQYDTEHRSVL